MVKVELWRGLQRVASLPIYRSKALRMPTSVRFLPANGIKGPEAFDHVLIDDGHVARLVPVHISGKAAQLSVNPGEEVYILFPERSGTPTVTPTSVKPAPTP